MVNGIIFKGSRVVIPKSMQQSIKSKLHKGHLGIVITQLQARNYVYWINIDSEIVDMISSCPSHIQYQNKQQKETLIQHEVPKQVWTKVGTDLFSIFNNFVIVVDYTYGIMKSWYPRNSN